MVSSVVSTFDTPALTRKLCFGLTESLNGGSAENLEIEDATLETSEEVDMDGGSAENLEIEDATEETSEEVDMDGCSTFKDETEEITDSLEFEGMDETAETSGDSLDFEEKMKETKDSSEVMDEMEVPSAKTAVDSLEVERKMEQVPSTKTDMQGTPALPRKQLLQKVATPVAKTPEWSKSLSRELEEVIAKQNMLTSRTRRRVLLSLQENYNTEEDGEMEKLRLRAVKEIINSEKSYLKHLEIIEEYFMDPIREKGLLPQHVYVRIFGDILGIRQVNKEVLSELEESTDHIGKVFQELAPYLKFYSTYANDFEEAIKLVEVWRAKDKDFRTLLDNQESRPEVQMRLNSLLITPVQRIPRYKLLLDDIIKNTPRFHPDRTNLETARTEIDSVAWHINDQIKEHEAMKRMVDIEKSIQGGIPKIMKPGRKLVREGNLMKVNKNGNHAQPRYVVLFSDMLMYCKHRGTRLEDVLELPKAGALEVCCLLPLKHLSVEEVVGRGVFTIRCRKEELLLYSSNAEDSDWVDSITKTAKLLKKNVKSLKRESSKFEPMRKKEMLKMRRESLGTIMMTRKREEEKRKKVKKELKIGSPLYLITSKKRKERDEKKEEGKLEIELELEQIISEDEVNDDLVSPSSKPRSPKTPKMCSPQSIGSSPIRKVPPSKVETRQQTPDRASLKNLSEITEASPILPNLKSESMTMLSRKAILKPIHLARTMSLRLKRNSKAPAKTVFRSPSMKNQFSYYDDPILDTGLNVSRTSTMKPLKLEKVLHTEPDELSICDPVSGSNTIPELIMDESKKEGDEKHDKSHCVLS